LRPAYPAALPDYTDFAATTAIFGQSRFSMDRKFCKAFRKEWKEPFAIKDQPKEE